MLLMDDLIIHLSEIGRRDFGPEQNLCSRPVLWKLARLLLRCGQNA
jgi:hypothetical protein